MAHVLIVENNPGDILLLQESLSQILNEVDIKVVSDGAEVMPYLADPARPIPEIAFIDLDLPKVNGIEILHSIRSRKEFDSMRIVLWTSLMNPITRTEILENGAQHVCVKPMAYQDMRDMLKEILSATLAESLV